MKKEPFTENCCLEDLENINKNSDIMEKEVPKGGKKDGDGGWDDIEGL